MAVGLTVVGLRVGLSVGGPAKTLSVGLPMRLALAPIINMELMRKKQEEVWATESIMTFLFCFVCVFVVFDFVDGCTAVGVCELELCFILHVASMPFFWSD